MEKDIKKSQVCRRVMLRQILTVNDQFWANISLPFLSQVNRKNFIYDLGLRENDFVHEKQICLSRHNVSKSLNRFFFFWFSYWKSVSRYPSSFTISIQKLDIKIENIIHNAISPTFLYSFPNFFIQQNLSPRADTIGAKKCPLIILLVRKHFLGA